MNNINLKSFLTEWAEWTKSPNLNKKTIKDTGFDIIDNQLQGLRPNQLIILGGRPGAGKTTFALNVMDAIDKQLADNERILFISLEQSASEILQKTIALNHIYPLRNFYNSQNIVEELNNKFGSKLANTVKDSKIVMVDSTDVKAEDISKIILKYQDENKVVVRAVFIDHIQILSTAKYSSTKYEQACIVSRELKKLALGLEIPVFALSQMSRDWAKEKKKFAPSLTDLRDSGSLEQDADIVMFIYQRENNEIPPTLYAEPVNISIAKNRNGSLGSDTPLCFFSSVAKMVDATNQYVIQSTQRSLKDWNAKGDL
ncbi:DnaB-like helicase C-terminal domain-containing protein [Mycoplasma seminis]|uniref:DnaB-like helicase C-terminal domain-containing protein n=1 Tax=Mycoplasma seminis TaxID=512749 RepID=A0ABY9H9Z2_9MOLU|nr:DnaB-like helicase C-terminal domain-containing protein [Mycoplasma seminis]WLP85236.1 DnaB-like helicase C-terminal domain-containing protein [Mycoplasma seminis]